MVEVARLPPAARQARLESDSARQAAEPIPMKGSLIQQLQKELGYPEKDFAGGLLRVLLLVEKME